MRRPDEAVAGGILVGLASLQFGIVVVLGATLLRSGLSVGAMLAIRFAVAGVLLAVVAAARSRPVLPEPGERLRLALLGIGGYSVEAALFFAGIRHGTASAVTLLFFTYPVLVALTSVLVLREKAPGRLVGGALAAAVAGAALVVATGGRVAIRPAGVAFALGAAVMFTVYLLGVDRTMRRTEAAAASSWVALWAAAGLLLALPVMPGDHTPSATQWLQVSAMGAGTAGAFVCLMAGLRRLGPVRTSIIAAAEPLSSTLLSIAFLDERLRPGTIAGGILILGGATAASLARRPVAEPEVP